MVLSLEELGWADTPTGVISLRRRHVPVVGHDVCEVKIDDEFLMSSLFTVGLCRPCDPVVRFANPLAGDESASTV